MDLEMKNDFLSFSFVMIYIIHKMLVLLKNHLNYPKESIFKFFEKIFFFVTCNDGKFK